MDIINENIKKMTPAERQNIARMDNMSRNIAYNRSMRKVNEAEKNMRILKTGKYEIAYQTNKSADIEKCNGLCVKVEMLLSIVETTLENVTGRVKGSSEKKSLKNFFENTDEMVEMEIDRIKNCELATCKSECPVMKFVIGKIQDIQTGRTNLELEHKRYLKDLFQDCE